MITRKYTDSGRIRAAVGEDNKDVADVIHRNDLKIDYLQKNPGKSYSTSRYVGSLSVSIKDKCIE